MDAKLVSIVMPAHNSANYISKAIESVLAQTFDNFEFIIIDDSSTDNTWDVIKDYASKDNRIYAYQVQVRNAGLARNFGVKKCQSDYIMFMDSDDIAYENRLEKQLAYMEENPSVVVVGAYLQMITADGAKMGIIQNGPTTLEEFHALDRSKNLIRLYGTITMVRRDAFDKVGGFLSSEHFQEIHGTEDGELWDRMAAYGECISLPEVLIDYRQHTQSLSVTNIENKHKVHRFIHIRYAKQLKGENYTLDEFLKYYDNLSFFEHFGITMRTRSELMVKNGQIYKAENKFVMMSLSYIKAFVYHPVRFIMRLFLGKDPSVWRI